MFELIRSMFTAKPESLTKFFTKRDGLGYNRPYTPPHEVYAVSPNRVPLSNLLNVYIQKVFEGEYYHASAPNVNSDYIDYGFNVQGKRKYYRLYLNIVGGAIADLYRRYHPGGEPPLWLTFLTVDGLVTLTNYRNYLAVCESNSKLRDWPNTVPVWFHMYEDFDLDLGTVVRIHEAPENNQDRTRSIWIKDRKGRETEYTVSGEIDIEVFVEVLPVLMGVAFDTVTDLAPEQRPAAVATPEVDPNSISSIVARIRPN